MKEELKLISDIYKRIDISELAPRYVIKGHLRDARRMLNDLTVKLSQHDVSHSASLVLNYLKKHKCNIEFYWWCGIQQYKVVVNGERKNYPRINDDTWWEIKPHLKKIQGEYQTGETWSLHCG